MYYATIHISRFRVSEYISRAWRELQERAAPAAFCQRPCLNVFFNDLYYDRCKAFKQRR